MDRDALQYLFDEVVAVMLNDYVEQAKQAEAEDEHGGEQQNATINSNK